MKKKKGCLEVLARGVFFNGEKILLCHTKGAGNTYLPGGHVEFGESVRSALAREVKEELGRRAVVGRFLGAVEHTFRQKGRRHCEINLVFEMKIHGLTASKVPVSRESYIEFCWVPQKDLHAARLEPAVLIRILGPWLHGSSQSGAWASNYRIMN